MVANEPALYAYELDNRRRNLILVAVAAAFLAFAGGAAVTPWLFLLLLVPVVIIVHLRRAGLDRQLVITGRYLILGERIVYYRTLKKIVLDQGKQTLTLSPDRSQPLVLAAEKFPTNARKADKIKANKRKKFDSVTAKIIDRVREIPLEVTVVGRSQP